MVRNDPHSGEDVMRRPRGGIETAWSHWSQLMEDMQASPNEMYQSMANAIERRAIPKCKLRRVTWREGGWGSANRLYLRAERGDDLVDICAAPFGTGFFASSWLCTPPPSLLKAVLSLIAGIVVWVVIVNWLRTADPFQLFGVFYQVPPRYQIAIAVLALDMLFVLGVFLFGIIRPIFFPPRPTYYRYDTAQMFYNAVHNAVVEVIQARREALGLRLLTDDETKPIMRAFR
jgi:hypothetical protein